MEREKKKNGIMAGSYSADWFTARRARIIRSAIESQDQKVDSTKAGVDFPPRVHLVVGQPCWGRGRGTIADVHQL